MTPQDTPQPAPLLVVCGPTASGKTAMGVALAHLTGGEVVSADSMQIYRQMDIGTAKPTAQEMEGVPHHMLDVADPGEDYSVARYVEAATACVDDILSRGKLPILVGGTGMYIDNLIAGQQFAPFSGHWRKRLTERLETEGIAPLHAELAQVDPQRAAKLHPGDKKRILRALEVWHETGETITAHDLRTQALPPRYHAVRIGLNFKERACLYQRIDQRVDEMMSRGLVQEVRALMDAGIPQTCTAMQAIGYKEMAAALLTGEGIHTAAEEIKLRSRRYAKRQLTWFRRDASVRWIMWDNLPDLGRARQEATAYLAENGLL